MTVEIAAASHMMYDQGDGTWKTSEPSGEGNLPSGFTQLESRNFDSTSETGWWAGGSRFSVVASPGAEAESTSGNVGQYFFQSGDAGGEAPGSTGIDVSNSTLWLSGSDEVFLRFRFRVSSDWGGHPTGTNKIFYITMAAQGGNGDPAFMSLQTDVSPWQVSVRSQGTGDVSVPNTGSFLSTVGITPGDWYTVELHLVRNTTAASTDGAFALWVNGTKTQEDLSCSWHNTTGAVWDSVKWEPVWGGGGGTVPNDMEMQMSFIDLYVKGGV